MDFNPWICDCDPRVEEVSVLKLITCVARRVPFFCNHCLNGKIIMVKKKKKQQNKSRVYYSLRTLCYITMERLIKQNVVVSGCVLC